MVIFSAFFNFRLIEMVFFAKFSHCDATFCDVRRTNFTSNIQICLSYVYNQTDKLNHIKFYQVSRNTMEMIETDLNTIQT